MSLRLGILLLVVGAGVPLIAQTATPDPIRELLVEVRGLRAAMERSATVNARIQLLVARVQLQEQRIAEVSRQINSARSELRSTEDGLTAAVSNVKRLEMIAGMPNMPTDERGGFQRELEMMKTQVELAERRRQELTNEVNFLSAQVTSDQARWTEFNSQLDELERSLIQASKQR